MNYQIWHEQILAQIKLHSRPQEKNHNTAKYLGTSHLVYRVSIPELRQIAKLWFQNHRQLSQSDLVSFIGLLFGGRSREEKVVASMILSHYKKLLPLIDYANFGKWLGQLSGWEEIDNTCWNALFYWFLANKQKNMKFLLKLSRDQNIAKRRASLVILAKAALKDDDREIVNWAFQLIDNLKHEKDILITKAVSWLLRSLVKYHKSKVAIYLVQNKDSLPKIAFRETKRKLETGKK